MIFALRLSLFYSFSRDAFQYANGTRPTICEAAFDTKFTAAKETVLFVFFQLN